jgi:hypothetical protein
VTAPPFACPSCHAPAAPQDLTCRSCGVALPARAGPVQDRGRLTAGIWAKLTRRCGWCDAHTRDPHDDACDRCGGPLPPLPPRILAELALGVPDWPEPPPAPRTLPRGYESRVRFWKNTSVSIGVAFVLALPFVPVFPPLLLFPLLGAFVGIRGAREASRWIRALKGGQAVEGTLISVDLDRNQSINHQHPWKLDFRFQTPAGPAEGYVTSWDALSGQRQAGERVWVVVDPKDSAVHALWPPVS